MVKVTEWVMDKAWLIHARRTPHGIDVATWFVTVDHFLRFENHGRSSVM